METVNRKQKRRVKQGAKIVAVCGAVIYLSASVLALEKEPAQEPSGSPIPTYEASVISTENLISGADENLEPEVETLESPYNTMSLDWDAEQIAGFKEYQIPEEYAREGGYFPVELQQFTYVICGNYGVDYELILAMIEVESSYRNDAESTCGAVGYMQVIEKWHKGRMERLNVEDLSNPYSNIMVGVDYMAELLENYPEEIALGIYNMGYKAVDFWNDGKIITEYAETVLSRRMEIFMEDMAE